METEGWARTAAERRLGVVKPRDEMGGTGSARARQCVIRCADRRQNASAYPVIEVALSEWARTANTLCLMNALEEYIIANSGTTKGTPFQT